MEAHTPRSGVHSFKQFVVEVAMIVLGVLIALGVEQVRERLHERRIANEARENFRREIELERHGLEFYFDHVQAPQKSMKKFLEARESGKAGVHPSYQTPNWQFLPTGAWDTAAATQAFSFMHPAEVQRYTLVHTGQLMFNKFEEQMHPVLADLHSLHDRTNLTSEEQRAEERDVRLVLTYLTSIDQSGHELMRYFDEVANAAEKQER
jgi:hypothetical protein